MKKNQRKTPIECKTLKDICSLPRDSVDCGDFWILTDGYEISIHEQKIGHESVQKISVPKAIFDKFVRWYTTGRKIK